MAKADMRASAKAISVSPTRSSGRLAKPLCTKQKRASADRCCRPCGATMDRTPPGMRPSNRFCEGAFSHSPLRKGNGNVEVVIGFCHPPGIAAALTSLHLRAGGADDTVIDATHRVKPRQLEVLWSVAGGVLYCNRRAMFLRSRVWTCPSLQNYFTLETL